MGESQRIKVYKLRVCCRVIHLHFHDLLEIGYNRLKTIIAIEEICHPHFTPSSLDLPPTLNTFHKGNHLIVEDTIEVNIKTPEH